LMFWDATMSNPNGDMLGSAAKKYFCNLTL